MGPTKDISRTESSRNVFSINDSINTSSWKCVVVIAIEKTSLDTFLLKNFAEEAASGRRTEIKIIDFQDVVLNILNDFTLGELPFKYAFLLNYSSIFKEAAEYVKNKIDIPLELLVKVVKALLFYLREESLQKTERSVSGSTDPIKAMLERPTNFGNLDSSKTKNNIGKKKVIPAKGKQSDIDLNVERGFKIRPPSIGKLNTKLLKRGETSKQDQWIDDMPSNSFFNLYILLTGFYNPHFPLELIKANIPLHGILCIDSSSLILKCDISTVHYKFRKQSNQDKCFKIEQFWDDFLNILWNPSFSIYFKEIIFQVFQPEAVICDKKYLKDFIYQEISFLMYDLTDYKRGHLNYLSHLKLWNVKDGTNNELMEKYAFKLENFPSECLTVPIILNYIIDVVAGYEKMGSHFKNIYSYDSIDLSSTDLSSVEANFSHSIFPKIGPSNLLPAWSTIVKNKNVNFVKIYVKIKGLDENYNLERKNLFELPSLKTSEKSKSDTSFCIQNNQILSENYQTGMLQYFCNKFNCSFKKNESFCVNVDFLLYPYLMTKIVCHYEPQCPRSNFFFAHSFTSNKISNYKLIENIKEQMYKPNFTVTQGIRNILRSIPYNVKESTKDFFSPVEYKILTPEAIRASSAPEFRVSPRCCRNISPKSEIIIPVKLLEKIDWNVFENLKKFLGSSIFLKVNDFDFVEILSKQKLLLKDSQISDEYNCFDHNYSVLTNSVLIVCHNRKNDDNIYRETFRSTIKTKIGLRDFFEYILEDEIDWFKGKIKLQKQTIYNEEKDLNASKSLFHGKDTYFWSENSIKYGERLKSKSIFKKDVNANSSKEFLKKTSSESIYYENSTGNLNEMADSVFQKEKNDVFQFEGYDIEDTAVQFSGLKTIYYAQDCSLTLDLTEKLYGDQTLGVHIRQGGHTLHLFSYVCPTPHLPQPYTYHFICNNGIILAFGKRFSEIAEDVDVKETFEERKISLIKLQNQLSNFSIGKNKTEKEENITNTVINEDYTFDLNLSTPNGLVVETIQKIGKPFYIKQSHPFKSPKNINNEICRLFLPNKNLIKIMKNGSVEVLKTDTSIFFALLNDLSQSSSESILAKKNFIFTRYDFIDSSGQIYTFDNERITTPRKFQTFQTTDLQSEQIFFRRKDGTNYVIYGNGTLCAQFEDGSKISSLPFAKENDKTENSENTYVQNETDFFPANFVVIYEEVTFEHPSYATIIYNTQTKKWKILMPSDLSVVIEKEGDYCAKIDKQTKFSVKKEFIELRRLSLNDEWLCSATADLSIFKKSGDKRIYCKIDDLTGNSFIVEPNANCYVIKNTKNLKEEKKTDKFSSLVEKVVQNSQDSLKCTDSLHRETLLQGTKLSRSCTYFVVYNDLTGLEVIHKKDFKKIITEINDDEVIFIQKMTRGEKLRCFVLIKPEYKIKSDVFKWEMNSILPDPKYKPDGKKRSFSSTYGDPPSWMHPFPKKKVKFKVPENFTCRVFLETKKTEFFPRIGSMKLQYCDLDEAENDNIDWQIDNMQDYLKKISAQNQDMLRKMYVSVVRKLKESKQKNVPLISEKFQRYLAMNKYYLNLQEYHKLCIKNRNIPCYFDYPAGMSWLILYDLITTLKFSKSISQQRNSPKIVSPSSVFSKSYYSNEEIEYNLSWPSEKSFSDLSYKSSKSLKSAPLFLEKANVNTTGIFPSRKTVSAPIFIINEQISSHRNIQGTPEKFCKFTQGEINFLKQNNKKLSNEQRLITLGDLFRLGLV